MVDRVTPASEQDDDKEHDHDKDSDYFEDDESVDEGDLEDIFTALSNKNAVEAHKWLVKNKTLCIGSTKGKVIAFHKQNKLNSAEWQMTFRNHNGLENEGFPMKNGRPKYDALCTGWYWKADDFPDGALDTNCADLRSDLLAQGAVEPGG